MHDIGAAFREVRDRIDAAARKAGRSAEQVTLVTVSKTRSPEEIRLAVSAGADHLGENYVQELVDKWREFGGQVDGNPRWHFIGHLQRNKVKYLAPFCELIHSVEDERLAAEIDRRACEQQRRQALLLEVNIAGEESKFGLSPEQVAPLAEKVAELPGVQLRGLMAMTPLGASPEACRRYFAQVRELSEGLAVSLPEGAMAELSMGMTQDYEVAVEEGATLVRVGTAIFGPRPAR